MHERWHSLRAWSLTGAVAAGLAYSEGAWGGANTEVAGGSAGSAATSASGVDTAVAPPSTIESDADVPAALEHHGGDDDPPSPETTPPSDAPGAASGYADGVHLGTAEYTEWGNVQVEVTIGDGIIVDVAAVEYPTGRRSSEINEQAVPMLEAQAIALQSADLDVVSGATYTSRTYADSLQAALDQAASCPQRRMSRLVVNEVWWYLSRSSGIVATVLVVAALVCGLRFSARATGTRRRPKWWSTCTTTWVAWRSPSSSCTSLPSTRINSPTSACCRSSCR